MHLNKLENRNGLYTINIISSTISSIDIIKRCTVVSLRTKDLLLGFKKTRSVAVLLLSFGDLNAC